MHESQVKLLVVDDDEFNRDILHDCLSSAGYGVTLAADGEEAWQLLNAGAHEFSVVLLDRMMPRLDGMGLLQRIKADMRFLNLPVVFQTALDNPADIAEGMRAGAFYYLTKPVSKDILLAIVLSAVRDHLVFRTKHDEVVRDEQIYRTVLSEGEIRYSSLQEARALAIILSDFFPVPQRSMMGLTELLVNAVEHGNLGISYQEKSRLLQDAQWEQEIERRLSLPENAKKEVSVLLQRLPQEVCVTITDCGSGFDWHEYLEMSPKRAFDLNGRGIAMSRMMSFDALEYQGKGNQVLAVMKKDQLEE